MAHKRMFSIITAVILAMFTSVGLVAAATTQSTPVRGVYGDMWADIVLGKPNFGEMGPNEVTGSRVFNPGGVVIDRSVTPNRIYVYDGGNSRVLGLHVGNQSGQRAELVLGQPDLDGYAACNHDGNSYPLPATPSASSLCSMPFEQVSPREGGTFANMAVDSAGNLYVPDFMNNRVLLYISPFTTDTIADDVWGQNDFSGMLCNLGKGSEYPTANSLCFHSPGASGYVGGVTLDSANNLWVTDNYNNRVLRFPYDTQTGRPSHTANLVLGEPNFITVSRGSTMNKMFAPAAVRLSAAGQVYVADSRNNRVLIFDPPFSNGMTASRTLGTNLHWPTSVEFDLQGNIWVSDSNDHQLLRFTAAGVVDRVLFKSQPDYSQTCGGAIANQDGPNFNIPSGGTSNSVTACDSRGSIGIDSDGNIWVSGSSFTQDIRRYPAPFPALGIGHAADVQLFKPNSSEEANSITAKGLSDPRGMAIIGGQLIVTDISRILFWNNAPDSLTNGKAADGFIGPADFHSVSGINYGKVKADRQNHLWVVEGDNIKVYQLPLTTGASPFYTFPTSIPVKGGGSTSLSSGLSVGGIAVTNDSAYLWVTDSNNNRVLRIADPLTNPMVDIVLGQLNINDNLCNQGATKPSQNSLCQPGSLALDPGGNLFVSGFTLEDKGDYRLLEYDANLLSASPDSALFNIPASRVYGTSESFTVPGCLNQQTDPLCRSLEPTFDNNGRMVIGLSGYTHNFFPLVYQDPLNDFLPVDTLKDFYSMPSAATYDDNGDLFVVDQNRGRLLVYLEKAPGDPTRTPIATRTKAPTPTITPTPIKGMIKLYSVAIQDGWILESAETSNKGGSMNRTEALSLGDDKNNKQYRSIISFSTSALPDNATITGVILKLKKKSIIGNGNPMSIFQGLNIDIQPYGFNSTQLNLEDFSLPLSYPFGPFNPVLTNNTYTLDLTTAKDFICKDRLTQFRLRFTLDDNNNQAANILNLYSGDAALANRPQLIISYTTP